MRRFLPLLLLSFLVATALYVGCNTDIRDNLPFRGFPAAADKAGAPPTPDLSATPDLGTAPDLGAKPDLGSPADGAAGDLGPPKG